LLKRAIIWYKLYIPEPFNIGKDQMATVEKLQEHLKKAQSNLAQASKKDSDTLEMRNLKKKTKRLARKVSKITATEKMAELKKKKKKDRKTTSE
jgi:hypothetical protein